MSTMRYTYLLLCCAANAFIVPSRHEIPTTLLAKKSKGKRKIGAAAAGGGFGKEPAAADVIDVDDDYSAFPALEAGVKETLVPAPAELQTVSSDLDTEIYGSLLGQYVLLVDGRCSRCSLFGADLHILRWNDQGKISFLGQCTQDQAPTADA